MNTNDPGSTTLQATPEQLRELALAHRRVVLAVLFKLLYFPLMFSSDYLGGLLPVVESKASGIVSNFLLIYWLLVLVFSLFTVYKLASMIKQEQGIGILYAGLMFIPIVSLFVLLSLSQKSIRELKEYGIKIGIMGADMNSIDCPTTE